MQPWEGGAAGATSIGAVSEAALARQQYEGSVAGAESVDELGSNVLGPDREGLSADWVMPIWNLIA